MMRHSLVLLLLVSLLTFQTTILSADEDVKANTKASGRIEAAGTVLDEIEAAPDQRIPEEVLGSAECVAVVPSLLKGGFVVGGRYGKGVASCRTEKGWSAPAFFTIGGGSFGLQIGGQAVDLVMLIMNKNGMNNLLSSQFKLGADASAAAGPVGRHASADTDWKMRAEVLTSRAPAASSPDSNSTAPSSSRTKTAPANSTAAWCPSRRLSRERSKLPKPLTPS